jgi:hypothetical protein
MPPTPPPRTLENVDYRKKVHRHKEASDHNM